MKLAIAASFALLSGVAAVSAQPAAPANPPVCLRLDMPKNIDHTHVVDDRTVLFYMRDGKIWKNTLKSPCPGLLFHGFSFLTHYPEVCSNAQGIQVLVTGQVCSLGEFTPYQAPSPSP